MEIAAMEKKVMVQQTTDRQNREREFYEEYVRRNTPTEVSFEPIEGKERRPFNSEWRFFELLQENVGSSKQRLLDLGCGPGVYSILFAKIGYQVLGVDIAPSNIAIANNLAKQYGFQDSIAFSVSIAEALQYPDEYFDVVAGIDILHHVDIEISLAECMRVLKPRGIAMFLEPVRAPIFDTLRETKFGTWLVSKAASLERHITPDERKLTDEDWETIKRFGAECAREKFLLFSRLDRFIKGRRESPSYLEKVDARLFKWFPLFQRFGGRCLIRLRK